MSISTYIILGLIGLAIVLIIGALIYTKIIKPNTFSYSSKSYVATNKIKSNLKELKNQKVIENVYTNLSFVKSGYKPMTFEYIVIANKIVFICNPVYWNVYDVKMEKNEFVAISGKDKKQTLPLDTLLFIDSCKNFKKIYKIKNESLIVVPFLNKDFVDKQINNIDFININNLNSYLSKIEIPESDLDFKEFEKQILKEAIVPRKKRGIIKERQTHILK